MDNFMDKAGPEFPECCMNGCELYEIRAGTDDGDNFFFNYKNNPLYPPLLRGNGIRIIL
jgi:hypothetical protein